MEKKWRGRQGKKKRGEIQRKKKEAREEKKTLLQRKGRI